MSQELSPKQLKATDSQYAGFPPFRTWAVATVDEAAWAERMKALESARAEAPRDVIEDAVRVAVRAAATDTGAIEGLYQVDRGFTFTVATQAAAWQTVLSEKGVETRNLIEAQIRTYELLLDGATQEMPVTEAFVRRIHEEICGPQKTYIVHTAVGPQEQPLPKGKYKTLPNHVLTPDGDVHAYAPVSMTASEMHGFVEEVRGESFQESHPVLQAAYSHYALVAIHPFADGNGRVARALASIWLYRSASVPLLVLADQKNDYLAALRTADSGEPQAFVDFTFDRSVQAIQLVEQHLAAAALPSVQESLSGLSKLFIARRNLSHEEIDRVALKVTDALQEEFAQQLSRFELPQGVSAQAVLSPGGSAPPAGYRHPIEGGPRLVQLAVQSQAPAAASISESITIFVATDPNNPEVFLLHNPATDARLAVTLEEAYPDIRAALKLRMAAWVEAVLRELFSRLNTQAQKALKASGY